MRDRALELAVLWHKEHNKPGPNYPDSAIIDTAKAFLVFLEAESEKVSAERKNLAVKGQPRS